MRAHGDCAPASGGLWYKCGCCCKEWPSSVCLGVVVSQVCVAGILEHVLGKVLQAEFESPGLRLAAYELRSSSLAQAQQSSSLMRDRMVELSEQSKSRTEMLQETNRKGAGLAERTMSRAEVFNSTAIRHCA